MADVAQNRFKTNLLQGRFDAGGSGSHIIMAALLTSSHTQNADYNYWTTISGNEASGTGYSAGGQALTTKTVTQDDTDDEGVFDADDVTWSSSTVTARYCALYDNTLTTKDLLCVFDFGANYSSSAGNFTIVWAAEGIININ